MRAVVQRVASASVSVDGKTISSIDRGLLILLGVGPTDTEDVAQQLAKKIAAMRIFPDADGKMNLSVREAGGAAIVVSQFTLYADTRKGNRPSFIGAAAPDLASPLCARFVEYLTEEEVPTQTGEFGAHMLVSLVNDGPVTILLEV
jgi:D-tyrosyl-tRNA(Tyr) deacylase